MGSLRVVILLGVLLLAGCASPDAEPVAAAVEPEPAAGVPTAAPPAAESAGLAPVWSVGDAWAITTTGDAGEESSFLVVTKADGSSYTVEPSSDRVAGWDAIFDMSYVGKIRASDLAGHQQGEPVKYFDFPLEDGKSWTTPWDGEEIVLTATRSARGFAIVGTLEGEPYVEYEYASDLKWFSRLYFVRDGYGIRVDRFEPGWTGAIASGVAAVVFEGAPAAPVASPSGGAFTIDEGQLFAVAMLAGGGTQWAYHFQLIDPAGEPYFTQVIPSAENQFMGPQRVFHMEEIPATPGEWHIAAPAVHDPEGGFWVTITQVAVSTREFAG